MAGEAQGGHDHGAVGDVPGGPPGTPNDVDRASLSQFSRRERRVSRDN
ncbi:MAG TPA: hypothetical protein VLS91_03240 [Acidimicrobiales bacterium]|nr:hypothetical protein [Acidimicrobiales bacterium]